MSNENAMPEYGPHLPDHYEDEHSIGEDDTHRCCEKIGKSNGYIVFTNNTLSPGQKDSLSKLFSENGIVNLTSVHALHVATANKYKKTIAKVKRDENIDKIKRYREEYQKREDVKERTKKYNERPDVKERKKENQKKRNAVITKLRHLDPNLFAKLMWEERNSHEEESVAESNKSS
jgi:hypothetical protein